MGMIITGAGRPAAPDSHIARQTGQHDLSPRTLLAVGVALSAVTADQRRRFLRISARQ